MTSAETYSQLDIRGGTAILPRAIFKLTGADRVRYLNGQVTNNVTKLAPGSAALPACVLTAKGKMSAHVFIAAFDDHLIVDTDPALREALAARLERYIISDDVTLEDLTDQLSLIHILLPGDPELPSGIRATPSQRYGRPGLDVILPTADAEPLWQKLAVTIPPLPDDLLESLRIENAIPRWGSELGEDTIPVEAGLDQTSIDYYKGCYIGQEIISRIKSVGHVNRHLRIFVSRDGAPLSPGSTLHLPDAAAEAPSVGALTSAAHSFTLEKPIALGYLKRSVTADVLIARAPHDIGSTTAVLVRQPPITT